MRQSHAGWSLRERIVTCICSAFGHNMYRTENWYKCRTHGCRHRIFSPPNTGSRWFNG